MPRASKKKAPARAPAATKDAEQRKAYVALRLAARNAINLIDDMERDQALRLPYAGYAEAIAQLRKALGRK